VGVIVVSIAAIVGEAVDGATQCAGAMRIVGDVPLLAREDANAAEIADGKITAAVAAGFLDLGVVEFLALFGGEAAGHC